MARVSRWPACHVWSPASQALLLSPVRRPSPPPLGIMATAAAPPRPDQCRSLGALSESSPSQRRHRGPRVRRLKTRARRPGTVDRIMMADGVVQLPQWQLDRSESPPLGGVTQPGLVTSRAMVTPSLTRRSESQSHRSGCDQPYHLKLLPLARHVSAAAATDRGTEHTPPGPSRGSESDSESKSRVRRPAVRVTVQQRSQFAGGDSGSASALGVRVGGKSHWHAEPGTGRPPRGGRPRRANSESCLGSA